MIHKNVLSFLRDLSANNNREWFAENKARYTAIKEEFELFVAGLISEVSTFDSSVKGLQAKDCTFRIYRDVRFSKDKSPYKINMGGYIVPGGKKSGQSGYYLHIEPEGSFVAGGVHMPESASLKAIRENIYNDVDAFKTVLNKKDFNEYFSNLSGEKLKTAPKGFPKDWEDLELIKFKSFTAVKYFTDKEVLSADFDKQILQGFKALKPLNDFLNNSMKNA